MVLTSLVGIQEKEEDEKIMYVPLPPSVMYNM